MKSKLIIYSLCCLYLTGCAMRSTIIPGLGHKRPKVALVLGGGAARGFAHVGVIRALEKEKIPIDLIIGTSVGSLIGAIYAEKRDSFELEWTAFTLEKDDIFDFSLIPGKKGFARGDKLEKFVQSKITCENIEDLKIPFYAVSVDINTGEKVVFSKGKISKAVRASSAIPGVFNPVDYNDRLLVDGGVVGNVAPEVARTLGADIIIVVDIGSNVLNNDTDNIIEITLQAINIMSSKISKYKLNNADIIIKPDVGHITTLDFSKRKECMMRGIEAAEKAIPKINSYIKKWKK